MPRMVWGREEALSDHRAGADVHVVFGTSRAGSIRDGLRLLGCQDRVIGLPSDLSFGPVDPPDAVRRREWMRSVLRCPPCEMPDEAEEPWLEATAACPRPVFWACMSDAAEQACFLAFASRRDGHAFDLVDATGLDYVTVRGARNPWSIGVMSPEDIVASGLLEKRRPLAPCETEAAVAQWSPLRREDAPLRIVRDGRLVSAPLEHFDTVILAQASPTHEVAARLIGRTMGYLTDQVEPSGQSPNHVVLFGRILALGATGALDVRGPGPGLRDYLVARPHPR